MTVTVVSPLWGVIPVPDNLLKLYLSCFPVMGVILIAWIMESFKRKLFPRYGGYSSEDISVTPSEGLLPRYGGYSLLPILLE